MTPIIGDLIKGTVGKVVGRLADKYLPKSMSEADRAEFTMAAERLAIEEYKTAIVDVQGARELAVAESNGAPPWTRILTVTHRPIWSLLTLGVFSWTIIAPSFGLQQVELTGVHKEIMQTVIIFYFGGRSIEKTAGLLRKVM